MHSDSKKKRSLRLNISLPQPRAQECYLVNSLTKDVPNSNDPFDPDLRCERRFEKYVCRFCGSSMIHCHCYHVVSCLRLCKQLLQSKSS
ncbi:hypothetical protein Nepgr_023286 [Nepenthes gracilis]|uniref:Uncharacterized protein n=1 Tax=Nepenthes gracilis TaxID=150966 RepID=A0AAD3T2J7_NEPGR|nr:hypothetical protein Nepgr_023286 [Nepenthes gracilis]